MEQVVKPQEPVPGAVVPAAPSMVQTATMDEHGTVRMDFRMSPEDRAMARHAAQSEARNHASMLAANPAGLRGLFPSNKVRFVLKKRPSPPTLIAKES